MSAPIPTGQIVRGPGGLDLVLTRTLPGPVRDAWAYVTEPERTARWFGTWKGTGAPGGTIQLRMGFEEDSSWIDVSITECVAPDRLRVLTLDGQGSWDLSLDLTAVGAETEIRFVHHSVVPAEVGNIGPGWEYYLDQLTAVATGAAMPDWDDYFPAQQEYYEEQAGRDAGL